MADPIATSHPDAPTASPDSATDSAKASEAGKELARVAAGRGGRARANVLTPEQRSEIARHAVRTRWERAGKTAPPEGQSKPKDVTEPPSVTAEAPISMYRGSLTIGAVTIECHVLNDLRRVVTQREVVRILSGGRVSGNIQRYLQRHPILDESFLEGRWFPFKIPGSPSDAIGYEATFLVDLCNSYLEARDRGLLKPSQTNLAKSAETFIRASAKVGIIALIDEATGYQEVRTKRALQLKLQAFIAEEMQEWAVMFPPEFWLELARLEGIHYAPRNRPLRWGKYVMLFVYDAIDPDVGMELRKLNPDPHFLKNHHQWLRDFGREKVHDQIVKVVTIMKLCETMSDFRRKFAKVFDKTPQLSFDDLIDWVG